MTSKRKRRRPRSSSSAPAKKRDTAPVIEKDGGGKKERSGGQAARLPESPFPPFGVSLARGFRVVGASPAILATAFGSLLATWAVYIFLSVEPIPSTLALLVAVPPGQVLFTDAALVLGPVSDGTAIALTVAGITVLRGITFGLMCLLIAQQLREGRTSVPEALRSLPRTAIIATGVYLMELGIVLAVTLVMVRFIGEVAIIFLVPAGLYFLAFALVVGAAERDAPLPALRRGLRAARLPGTRHLSLVMAYFLVLFYVWQIAPFGILAPSTPSIGIWAYALVMTFVHVAVLAALVYRWLAVRDQVPAAAGPRGG